MNKRELEIVDIITKQERIEVARLAELLGVSQVTVRKDLDLLEDKGLVKREHGYAIIGSKDDINNRLAIHYEIKQRLAAAAAEMVQDGETVIIESGSSCALLADYLAANKKNVTIITNSAFIAGYIRKRANTKIVLLGGEYQTESQVMVGSLVHQCVQGFFVDKLFIGTDGFSEKAGFTGTNLARAEAVRSMAEQAGSVTVLTDSSKFGQQGVVSLLPLQKVGKVITDSGIPLDRERYLQDHGMEVITVQ